MRQCRTAVAYRRHHERSRLLAAAVATSLCLLAAAIPAWATGQVGEPAADFALPSSAGGSYTLSDYRGQVVLLFMVGYG